MKIARLKEKKARNWSRKNIIKVYEMSICEEVELLFFIDSEEDQDVHIGIYQRG